MKTGLCTVLLCLAFIPAYAQNAASQDHQASGDSTTALAQDYADRVNGLLRDIHDTLRTISERMVARTLTPQQAQKEKLAATRAMIARLETLSAVYDSKMAAVAGGRDRCTAESGASNDASTQRIRNRSTVSVRELESTVMRAAGQ